MRLVFKRKDNTDDFDLSEDALRRVVGNVRITGSCRAEWPLVAAAEDAIVADFKRIMFERRVTWREAVDRIKETRPLCFAISRVDKVACGDTTAHLVCE